MADGISRTEETTESVISAFYCALVSLSDDGSGENCALS